MHAEDFHLVSPPSSDLNSVWTTTISSDLLNHHKHTSCTITVPPPFFSVGGWGTERLRKLFRATQLIRDGARFKPRQYDSKVHILNICSASHNFPLAQSLSHFPFTTLPLPCFKGKEQGCPRSELCFISIATHHSGLLLPLPTSPQTNVCACKLDLTSTVYSLTHSDPFCPGFLPPLEMQASCHQKQK